MNKNFAFTIWGNTFEVQQSTNEKWIILKDPKW